MSNHPGRAPEQDASEPASRGRRVAIVQLIATAALAFSTLIAVTAVSIGFARADVIGASTDAGAAPLAIALLIGFLFAGMGGLTALMAEDTSGRD
jgi:hypothetical protein